MKKPIAVILAAALLMSLSSCGSSSSAGDEKASSSQSTSESKSEKSKENVKPTKLTNKMSDYEKAYVKKRSLSLLDKDLPEPDIKAGKVIYTKEKQIEQINKMLKNGFYTEAEAKKEIANAKDEEFRGAMINGVAYNLIVPPKGYDGGKLVVGDTTFKNKDEMYADVEQYCKSNNYDNAKTQSILKQTKAVTEAIISGNYTEMPDRYETQALIRLGNNDPYANNKHSWEYDADKLSAIKDKTEEYTVYDEQLGIEFLVHVTLPPNYDKDKTYPVLFMTDGVWRLNNHAELYKAMEDGEAADTILVSLAYEYNVPGTTDQFRNSLLIQHRQQFLDFITDDLMPYLCDTYNINCADSTLLGHSMGGVFSHHALYNSDKYENQPFGRYIIGSPATFNLYSTSGEDLDAKGGETDYGYFDRHETLDKKVWLVGGEHEDADFEQSYDGHDSILTSLKKMNERLESHKANVNYKLYDGHHSDYVPAMLLEYLKTEYPKD